MSSVLSNADFRQNPYPYYERLRRDSPVYRQPGVPWVISRYADVSAMLSDPQTFSSAGVSVSDMLVGMDAQSHVRIRKAVQQRFTLARIKSFEERIRAHVREALRPASQGAPFDLVALLAEPLPFLVMADFLGIEHSRLADVRRWTEGVMARDMARRKRCRAHLAQLFTGTAGSEGLTAAEHAAVGVLLLVAGTETIMNFIGNASLILARDRALQAALREDGSRMEDFLHEALRFESPVQGLLRATTRAVEVAGVTLPAGAVVAASLGSANRDASVFAEPDVFRMDRRPNRHVAFGLGPHYCLGAQLALLEASIAVQGLLQLGEFRLAQPDGPVPYRESLWVRGPTRLELLLDT
jgi:cytochrome P450